MRELAIVVHNKNENVSAKDTIYAIKNTGFKNVFVQWYNQDWKFSQEEQVDLCKTLGLNIIFAHLGYKKINSIWEDTEEGESLVEEYKRDIKECKERGIDLVIMHPTTKDKAPMYGKIGLDRIRKITEYANNLGVKVAFENTRIRGYLEYILENIKDENVGFCFDSGHFHARFKDEFDFEFVKNRIFAVHLHDNDRIDDLHLLPFDGTIDWKFVVKKLKECNYIGPITLELCYRYDYLNMSLVDFYKKGYEVGTKLQKMFEE